MSTTARPTHDRLDTSATITNTRLPSTALLIPQSIEEEWIDDALCSQTDPEIFFPERGQPTTAVAKAICEECPVKEPCLKFAMLNDESGIWGGLTKSERKRLAQNRPVQRHKFSRSQREARDKRIVELARTRDMASIAKELQISAKTVQRVIAKARQQSQPHNTASAPSAA